jgi:processive 1,2-diacylglycerol beta-glucosyltransferase
MMDFSGKRILLMFISYNSGHHRAALAIEKGLRQLSPYSTILNINAFRHTNPIIERMVNRAYMGIIKNKPEIWDYFYDNPKIVKNTKGLKQIIHRLNSAKLKHLIDDFKPNAIVCTQAFPCGMVADFKKFYGLDIPLFGVITDFLPHGFWIYENIDYYVVASDFTAEKLTRYGVPKHKIKSFGIPIDPIFTHPPDKK